jgi:hypothetical protein
MRILTNFSLSLAALLFGLVVMCSYGRAQSYSCAASYEQGFTTQTNPNGVWSYGYSSGFTSPVTLYDVTAIGPDSPTQQFWLSSSVSVAWSPGAGYNDGPAFDDGNVDMLANECELSSDIRNVLYSDLVFTAPVGGVYYVAGSFRGDQYGIGTVVGIVANGDVLFSSSVTSEGQIVPFDAAIALAAGGTVVFSVGPGGGLQNTGVSAAITRLPPIHIHIQRVP